MLSTADVGVEPSSLLAHDANNMMSAGQSKNLRMPVGRCDAPSRFPTSADCPKRANLSSEQFGSYGLPVDLVQQLRLMRVIAFFPDHVVGACVKTGDDFCVAAAQPYRHTHVPRCRVRGDSHRRRHTPSAREDHTSRPLPIDDLFLPPELDLEVVGHRKIMADPARASQPPIPAGMGG